MCENPTRRYIVTPEYKKSVYSNEYYYNTICDKRVVLIITTMWRWGEFVIDVSDEDHDKLMEVEKIVINDHCGEVNETTDGQEETEEIQNIDSYTEEEQKAIYECIYEDRKGGILYDLDVLEEEKGWVLDDTIYEIYGGFEMEPE